MTDRQPGSPQVRPNTLSDERAPNTFRIQAASGTLGTSRSLGTQGRDQGDANTPPRRRWAVPPLRLWVWVVLAGVAAFIALRLLGGAQ